MGLAGASFIGGVISAVLMIAFSLVLADGELEAGPWTAFTIMFALIATGLFAFTILVARRFSSTPLVHAAAAGGAPAVLLFALSATSAGELPMIYAPSVAVGGMVAGLIAEPEV